MEPQFPAGREAQITEHGEGHSFQGALLLELALLDAHAEVPKRRSRVGKGVPVQQVAELLRSDSHLGRVDLDIEGGLIVKVGRVVGGGGLEIPAEEFDAQDDGRIDVEVHVPHLDLDILALATLSSDWLPRGGYQEEHRQIAGSPDQGHRWLIKHLK